MWKNSTQPIAQSTSTILTSRSKSTTSSKASKRYENVDNDEKEQRTKKPKANIPRPLNLDKIKEEQKELSD